MNYILARGDSTIRGLIYHIVHRKARSVGAHPIRRRPLRRLRDEEATMRRFKSPNEVTRTRLHKRLAMQKPRRERAGISVIGNRGLSHVATSSRGRVSARREYRARPIHRWRRFAVNYSVKM